MNDKKQLLEDCIKIAYENIATTSEHLFGTINLCEKLIKKYNVDKDIVLISFYLMDCKINEARIQGKRNEHAKMAVEYAEELLNNYNISDEDHKKIINCIAAHHKEVAFDFLEAEIVANLDCYRFIHPYGVFAYLNFLAKNNDDTKEIIRKCKNKMDEKYNNISLEDVRKDLEEFYVMFSNQFDTILKED